MNREGSDAHAKEHRMAGRMETIEPFQVMRLLAQARELEAQGQHIVHMEIGEPDFPTPETITRAGIRALKEGKTHYTPALGLPQLRSAIAAHYFPRYGVELDPDRVVVTPGSSGALQLLFSSLIDAGDSVLLTDPGYPCNRHLIQGVNGVPLSIPVGAETGYCLTPELIEKHWQPQTKAVLVASPANPTGTVMDREALAACHAVCREKGGYLIVDEIYHGLVYDADSPSALEISDDLFVINSFSKYYGMTGWRLGWMVAPEWAVPALDRMAQNQYLSAPTPSQHAALAAFTLETRAILEERRLEFEERRDFLLPALKKLGFVVEVIPQGAFYIYVRLTDPWKALAEDSHALAERLLQEAGVAVTPGVDFGTYRAGESLRFAYTTSQEELALGIERLEAFLTQM